MSEEINKYLRDKIIASKDLFLHEAHSIENGEFAAYVVSGAKHHFESVVMTTKGLPDDIKKAKAAMDERFAMSVAHLKENLSRKGLDK